MSRPQTTPPPHPAAVDNKHIATDITRSLAGKIDGRPFEVLGRAPAASGDASRDAGQPLRVVQQRLVHVRRDVARGDRIDGDAAARPLVGEALGQLRDGALGRGVGGHREAALEAEQARVVDDGAAASRDGVGGQGRACGRRRRVSD